MIREVVLPTAKIGLFGATFLALARATGETVAVALVAGGVANVQFHLLYPGTSIASWIATEFGEAQGNEIAALMALGVLVDARELRSLLDQSMAGLSSAKGAGGRMSDIDRTRRDDEETGTHMRDEIRRISDQSPRGATVALAHHGHRCAPSPSARRRYRCCSCSSSCSTKGLPVVSHASFFTQLPQTPTLIAPNATGGVSNAIIGTLALTLYASIMAIPIGVLVGVYLAESDSKLAACLRVIAQTMAGAPSILMGLFAFSFIVQRPARRLLGALPAPSRWPS